MLKPDHARVPRVEPRCPPRYWANDREFQAFAEQREWSRRSQIQQEAAEEIEVAVADMQQNLAGVETNLLTGLIAY